MRRGGAYNNGNGCSGVVQVQYFPMDVLKLPLQLMECEEGGICNVMAGEVHRIKILSENFENHFKQFRDKFWKISRNTSGIFEKYFGKF